MIIKIGNLLEKVTSGVIVHGCNAIGVMGAGFALQVKKKYPVVYDEYREFLAQVGRKNALGICNSVQVSSELIIVNAITQDSTGTDKRYVNYEAVTRCFEYVREEFPDDEIHYPMIGAGLAGGNWNIISTIINETMTDQKHTLWVRA